MAWLRYLQETGSSAAKPDELAVLSSEMEQALELAETAAYTDVELAAYLKYWDYISTEKTLVAGKLEEGIQIGLKRALEKLVASGTSPEAARSVLAIDAGPN